MTVAEVQPAGRTGYSPGMTDDADTQQQKAPSEPEQDPTVHPAPPGNPPVDEEALEKSEEGLDKVVGR